jgi:hypothetical protein
MALSFEMWRIYSGRCLLTFRKNMLPVQSYWACSGLYPSSCMWKTKNTTTFRRLDLSKASPISLYNIHRRQNPFKPICYLHTQGSFLPNVAKMPYNLSNSSFTKMLYYYIFQFPIKRPRNMWSSLPVRFLPFRDQEGTCRSILKQKWVMKQSLFPTKLYFPKQKKEQSEMF